MEISKATIVSAVLLSISVGAMLPPIFQVAVTNFPLDEEGNIRVSQMNGELQEPLWKVISIVEDYNLTWTPESSSWSESDSIDLGSSFIGGYSRMIFYMRISNFTGLYPANPNQAGVRCYITSVYDYGEVERTNFALYWYGDTTENAVFRTYSSPWDMMEAKEPALRIAISGLSYTPVGSTQSISCSVSVGIYLRND